MVRATSAILVPQLVRTDFVRPANFQQDASSNNSPLVRQYQRETQVRHKLPIPLKENGKSRGEKTDKAVSTYTT